MATQPVTHIVPATHDLHGRPEYVAQHTRNVWKRKALRRVQLCFSSFLGNKLQKLFERLLCCHFTSYAKITSNATRHLSILYSALRPPLKFSNRHFITKFYRKSMQNAGQCSHRQKMLGKIGEVHTLGNQASKQASKQASNQPTPWSRALREKPKDPQLNQKFPAFYGTQRFITALP